MPNIVLHNTATHTTDTFEPIDGSNVRMYVCGPTVYDRAHLGNARSAVVFDILYRMLSREYPKVTYVRNFTDVDDKINAKAASSGRSIRDITDEAIGWYHDDMDAIGVIRPTHEPRATEYIDQIVDMIGLLIGKGNAYVSEGHVLFSVPSYEEYGNLFGRTPDDLIAGELIEATGYKHDQKDFVLWKPSDDGTAGWHSPWGRGRPGWHIECSAMAHDLLGESFDIHGGGLDLQFPHHENERTQSCCANPDGNFATVWMHNEMLQVNGKKMSKSRGNFITVNDLLNKGIPGEVIRFVLLSTHYRSPMDWTEDKVADATATLRSWANAIGNDSEPDHDVVDALSKDLNTSLAITRIRRLHRDGSGLLRSAALLGFDLEDIAEQDWAKPYNINGVISGWGAISSEDIRLIIVAIGSWMYMRESAQWKEADDWKLSASEIGIELSVNKNNIGMAKITKDLSNMHILSIM